MGSLWALHEPRVGSILIVIVVGEILLAAIQDDLKMISGRSTVPNIFIGQKNIGGNQELQARKAELADLLKNAGAI